MRDGSLPTLAPLLIALVLTLAAAPGPVVANAPADHEGGPGLELSAWLLPTGTTLTYRADGPALAQPFHVTVSQEGDEVALASFWIDGEEPQIIQRVPLDRSDGSVLDAERTASHLWVPPAHLADLSAESVQLGSHVYDRIGDAPAFERGPLTYTYDPSTGFLEHASDASTGAVIERVDGTQAPGKLAIVEPSGGTPVNPTPVAQLGEVVAEACFMREGKTDWWDCWNARSWVDWQDGPDATVQSNILAAETEVQVLADHDAYVYNDPDCVEGQTECWGWSKAILETGFDDGSQDDLARAFCPDNPPWSDCSDQNPANPNAPYKDQEAGAWAQSGEIQHGLLDEGEIGFTLCGFAYGGPFDDGYQVDDKAWSSQACQQFWSYADSGTVTASPTAFLPG